MKMKRILCIVLALVMLVGMFTVGASAIENEPTVPAGGNTAPEGGNTAPEDGNTAPVTIKFFGVSQFGVEHEMYSYLPKRTGDDAPLSQAITSITNHKASEFDIPRGHTYTVSNRGWFMDASLTTPVSSDDMVNASEIKVYTAITANKYYAIFKPSADSTADQDVRIDVYYGENYSLLSARTFTRDGYDFVCWMYDGGEFQPGPVNGYWGIEGDATFIAKWKEIEESEPEQEEPPVQMPLTPAVGTRIKSAVTVDCDNKHHDSMTFDYIIGKDSTPFVYQEDGKWYAAYPVDANYYAEEYSEFKWHEHYATTRDAVKVVLEKTAFGWKLKSGATVKVSCGHDWCGGYWHKHAITYTDGVKNATVFSDITYYQKTGEYTKIPANPVRAGYKFLGWSPAVSTKVSGCVTYVAQWAPANTPALTTKHVAYLKGYGGGLVKPEGEITRAEAITMLYRLMDAATIKEFYTTYNAFTDVAKDAWYNDAVSTLANAGVLRYKTGLLNPNEKITRAEFFYMLTKFSNVSYTGKVCFVDVPANYWAYEELALAQYLGWIKGYGGGILNPDDTITRAEVAASLNRVLGRTTCKVADTKKFTDNPTTAWYYKDIVEASIGH